MSRVLGLQVYVVMELNAGFVYVRQALYQVNYIPSPQRNFKLIFF